MNDVMKIIRSLEESDLLIKGVSKKIWKEAKNKEVVFPGMLLGTLGTSLSGNILAGKGAIRAGERTIPANICWSWRRLENALKTCLEDVFNTSSA